MHRHLRISALALGAAFLSATVIPAKADGGSASPASFDPTNKALAPIQANQPLPINALLGYVNAEPIFVHDLLRPMDENLRELAHKSRNIDDFRTDAGRLIKAHLDTYVANILMLTNAKAALTADDKTFLDLNMNLEKSKLLSKYGGSEALANQALRAEGSSVDKELQDMRRLRTIDLYLNKTLYPQIQITREKVLDEYQRTRDRWQQGAELELYMITLPVSRYLPKQPGENGELGPAIKHPTAEQLGQAQAAATGVVREIIGRLNHGANFAEMVRDYDSHDAAATTGGRTGNVKKGSLASRQLDDYAFSLRANTVGSEPQVIGEGDLTRVMVIKVGEKTEARTIPFGEAQTTLEKEMWEKQRHELYSDYLKKLYDAAESASVLEKVGSMADVATDVAVARYATQ